MESIKKRFGEQLRVYRKIKNLTQEKLAEKIGINLRQLARIESGESFVTAETLYNICIVLGVSPKLLFDFEIEDKTLMTGSGEKVYLKVVKSGNLIQLMNNGDDKTEYDDKQSDFDKRMQKVAINTNRDVIVDEIKNDVVYQTKIYRPDGNIDVINNDEEYKKYENLLNNISQIKNEQNKIEYMNLAYNSLCDRNALEELKTMIKGIELTL